MTFEGGEEGDRCLLEEVGENGGGEGGGGGGDLGVDVDEQEEGFVDVGPDFGGAGDRGSPGWGGDAGPDDGGELGGGWLGVGSEEAVRDLDKDVADGFGFIGEGDGEVGLKLGDELGYDVAFEKLDIAEGQEHAGVLVFD